MEGEEPLSQRGLLENKSQRSQGGKSSKSKKSKRSNREEKKREEATPQNKTPEKPKSKSAVSAKSKDEPNKEKPQAAPTSTGSPKKEGKPKSEDKKEQKDKPTPVVAPIPEKEPKDQSKQEEKPQEDPTNEKKPKSDNNTNSAAENSPKKEEPIKDEEKPKEDSKPAAIADPAQKEDDPKTRDSAKSKKSSKSKKSGKKKDPEEPKEDVQKPKDPKQDDQNVTPLAASPLYDPPPKKDDEKPMKSEEPPKEKEGNPNKEEETKPEEQEKVPFRLSAMFRKNANKKREEDLNNEGKEKKKKEKKVDKKDDQDAKTGKSDQFKSEKDIIDEARDAAKKQGRRGNSLIKPKVKPDIVIEGDDDPLLFDQIKEMAEKEEAKGTPRYNSVQVSKPQKKEKDAKVDNLKVARMSRSRREITYEDTRSVQSRGVSQYSFNPKNQKPAGFTYIDAQGKEKVVRAFSRFQPYRDVLENLTQTDSIQTDDPIVSVIITYDSSSAIAVTKKSDREYWVKQYSLQDYQMTFSEQIGGLPTSYIKCKEVEQNSLGNKFALVYYDDGNYKLRTFHKETRDLKTIFANELEINKAIQLNNFTMPINGLPDPFIVCSFIDSPDDSRIFVALFHNKTLMHYHFIYNDAKKEIEGPPVLMKMSCTKKNFPQKAFFNDDLKYVYVFYRQGQVLNVNSSNHSDFKFERMTNMDVGQMQLVNNKALIARSSSRIMFFKLMEDYHTKEEKWSQYFTLNLRGQITYIKGNIRIQVITDQNIYFFKIDPDSLEPILDNVMFNFMDCSMMLFESKVKFGICYKFLSNSFEVYMSQYEHDFLVPVVEDDCEGSKGLELKTINSFLVTKVDKIIMYDSETYQEIEQLPIQLLPSETREPNEIICMQKSDDEKYVAVISGKNLVMNNQKHNQLFVFKCSDPKKAKEKESQAPIYDLHKVVQLVDIAFFQQVCTQFYFKNDPKSKSKKDTIIFAKNDCIFELNFDTQKITTLYTFKEPLSKQPEFFSMNVKQNTVVVSSFTDGIYYNFKKKVEVDLDDQFNVLAIKEIIFDPKDNNFYMLCNKFDQKLGVFLIKFHQDRVESYSFLLKWKNKLQIADADLFILHNKEAGFRELVISYKTIYINTYNVKVIDISNKQSVCDGQQTLFRHESFQLWEQRIIGFILSSSKDYVLLSKQGIRIIALGDGGKRSVQDSNGHRRMIHSLESVNFLKVEPQNFILFECSDENKVISIYNEYNKNTSIGDSETGYQCIYRVKINNMTLRELLILQSLYVSKTQSHIVNLIKQQPNPSVFYKSCLELDCANMVSLLNFDSNSMKILLDEKYETYFSQDFPIFYKNKIPKYGSRNTYYFRSALDNALRNNQVGAVECIIRYIVNFQNNYVSHYLFLRNLPQIMQKGIKVRELLDSNIFTYTFDYDEWPSTHNIMETVIKPFSGSIFNLRDAYRTVFQENKFALINDSDNRASLTSNPSLQLQKEYVNQANIFKIKYSINLLTSVDMYVNREPGGPKEVFNRNVKLMDIINDNAKREFDNFDTRAIEEIIDFKWETFALKHHYVGWIMHIIYCLTLIAYINLVYINNSGTAEEKSIYGLALLAGISYPALYDFLQLCRTGLFGYLKDGYNYTDMLLIWSSIANCYYQQMNGPFDLISQSLMVMVVIMSLVKTFFFLRIFDEYSTVVTMLTTVIFDLKIFLFFFMILNMMFSLLIGIIGLANTAVEGKFRDKYLDYDFENGAPPSYEYKYLGMLVGNFLCTFRIAFGDYYQIFSSTYLETSENIMFWVCWLLIVTITAIVFLNFVIAEATASYEKINERVDTYIKFQKSDMIREAQDMTFSCFQTPLKFPKYIIIRSSEE